LTTSARIVARNSRLIDCVAGELLVAETISGEQVREAMEDA
jgi:hypothetical protein